MLTPMILQTFYIQFMAAGISGDKFVFLILDFYTVNITTVSLHAAQPYVQKSIHELYSAYGNQLISQLTSNFVCRWYTARIIHNENQNKREYACKENEMIPYTDPSNKVYLI